jgi:hypothetical protein
MLLFAIAVGALLWMDITVRRMSRPDAGASQRPSREAVVAAE